jgi:hypothetical protein
MIRDLTGQQFGKLAVVGPAEDALLPQTTGGWWTAECVCGRQITAPAEAFLSRRLTSCGRPTPEQRAEAEERFAATHPRPRW